jgi:hypothetical protein
MSAPILAQNKRVAQGKPVARRGRKTRDLSQTARLPTTRQTNTNAINDTEVLKCAD